MDIEGRIVVKKNNPLTFSVIHKILESGKRLKKTFIPLGDTPLYKDLKNIFNEEKYFTIFTPQKVNNQIADVIKDTKITKEIYEELKSMKEVLPYTFRHTLLVTVLSVKVTMDLKNEQYGPQSTTLVGLTHDIGKTRIPKHILGKDTPLKESEYEILKTHSLLSYLLLCHYLGSYFIEVLKAARDHHEKLDGSGYPRGIEKSGRYSKIIMPADIFDALISERPYRHSSFTIRQATDFLIDEVNMGKADKDVVYNLISYIRKEPPSAEEFMPSKRRETLTGTDNSYGKVLPDA